jgi:UPF0271 protein
MGEKVLVLDTTAFIARLPLYAPRIRAYTTSSVLSEVRDSESKAGLEMALTLERVSVLDPPSEYLERAKKEALHRGLHVSLSKTDLSVAALALMLRDRGHDVEVVTDDYALQNLLSFLGIGFRPIRTRGIRRSEEYIVVCPACGYRSNNPAEKVCPVCGTPLKRVRKHKSRRRGRTRP